MPTSDDRIEQQVIINASADRVWDLLSRPGWWAPTEADAPVDRTPGHQVVRESKDWGRFAVEVVDIKPLTYVAFRWASQFSGEELGSGRATLVEFQVEPTSGGIRVAVLESGFAPLDAPESVRRAALDGNAGGWAEELRGLRERAERFPSP
ncbi:MAG: SRPBCC domain-containing protein [Candidatus Dormibacteria bacterium]